MAPDTSITDSNLPIRLEKYKPVPQRAVDSACLSLAKRWLSTCQNGHQRCDEKFDEAGPSRLIDLRGDVIKLVLAPEESTQGSYVALSHCWGGVQPLQTTSETLASFQVEIPVHRLPPTFSDAIYVARALGFTHIWIDSLCIVQDDKLDWEHQSSIMASIYSNADLVLAGAAGKSANEGFLRKERSSCEGTVSLDIRGSATSFVYKVVPNFHEDIDEPLYKRAWTFQERLCARRFLAYGNWEMSWECKESSCCEHHGNNTDGYSTSQQNDMFGARMEHTNPEDFVELWKTEVVKQYCQRSLTKATDTPVAISALASRFQSRFQGTYLAGLWAEDLCANLLWWTYLPGYQSSSFAPSWSWMSPELPLKLECYYVKNLQETLVHKVQTEVKPSTTNLFGPVSTSTIRLTGMLVPASLETNSSKQMNGISISTLRYDIRGALCWLDTPLVRTNVHLMDGTEERTTRRAMKEEESSGTHYPVTLLPILKDDNLVNGLILGRSATCIGAYERVGLVRFHGDFLELMRKDYDACDITLV
ncbi:hypothetical protein AG0111_0g3699 [Alternaria gaisen]|uniref:Uncharacterized protein n=1 Tax=Alternaria gaisen TaxID=167740 RepID=A0ACB6FS21_9PLEO|nr:hypothetical protein AG0111_0g3699 [Alternaria gaisen]